MKRILSVFLAVLLCVSAIPLSMVSVNAEASGDYEYSVNDDGETITITDYTGTETDVNIPSEIDCYRVTKIGGSAFYNCTKIETIVMPNSITEIGTWAFAYCTALEDVVMPNGITDIGSSAFSGCKNITSITIPKSVISIGSGAFRGCSNLNQLSVDSDNIIYYSSQNCIVERNTKTLIAGCKNSVIPEDVINIGDYAFYGCSGLTSVDVPETIVNIGDCAFYGCSGLTSISIPNIENINDGMFYNCTSLKEIVIPEGVQSVGECAFWGCSSLKQITFPKSVTMVDKAAFGECTAISDVYYGGIEEEWLDISFYDGYRDGVGIGYDRYILNATIHYTENPASIAYGVDRFSFGEEITGTVGDEIETLLLYTSANNGIESLSITSSNSDIVEIGTINIGTGEYIAGNNEHVATIPLKLKAEGSSTITIISPEGISTSVNIIVQKSSYEVKLYSEVPALVVGKGRQIGAAVQLENNGVVVEGDIDTVYSFASSNNNIVSLADIQDESDGTYFTIKGIEEGSAVITITENNTGAVFSGVVQVNQGILTFNAEALPSYYDKENEYNGYIGGMYIDEFQMTEKDDNTMSVTFNVYNTVNIVGAVDVYDSDGNIISSEQIKRFDGGYVTSIKDTLISGYKLIEDIFISGNILTYKQDNYSVKTPISIDVPKGGHIEITNDPLYSNTCAIYNCSEFITTSILMFGDVISVDAKTQKEISAATGKNIVDKFLKEYIASLSGKTYNEKIVKLGEKFIEKLTEKSLKKILLSSVTGELSSFVDEGKAILEDCDIDLEETIISSAGSIGISIAEGTLKKAMGPFGEVLNGMFKVSEYASYSNFLVDLCKSYENHALCIYFDNENGCLSDNGVSIKAENGTTDLSELNYVMHSIVLSKEDDLNGQMKEALDNISSEYVVRNIYLERDGEISQPGQPVQVTIPVPEDWIPDYCKLYWVQEDGTLQEIQAMASFNNLVFTTDHFSYYALVYDAPNFSINGTITNFGDVTNTTTVQLLSDGIEIVQASMVCGTYTFSNISAGTYTLEVSKSNHVTRTYEIVVEDSDITQDVEIYLIGDINGDGEVTVADYGKALAHVRKTSLLEGYALECADVNLDGSVTVADYGKILAHVRKTTLLW